MVEQAMSETDNHRSSRLQPARHENTIQTRYKKLIREAEATVRVYTPAETMDLVGQAGIFFVDVRDTVELSEGMVSGAIHVPRGRLEAHLVPNNPRYASELEDVAEIIFYCANGARSSLAAYRARELGYGTVGHLDGGISAWKEAGGPMDIIEDTG